jgi:hypothetical protein
LIRFTLSLISSEPIVVAWRSWSQGRMDCGRWNVTLCTFASAASRPSESRWWSHSQLISSFRCWQQARGGGVWLCWLLYRSSCGLPFRLGEVAVPGTRFVKGATTVTGDAAGWRVDRARASLGASRRRAAIHGR